MTLQDILRHEPPQRRARIPKGSPRQKKLYDFICAHFSEIETAQEQGYTWTQLSKALDVTAQKEGVAERYSSSEYSAMFAFVRKERDIKGVQ